MTTSGLPPTDPPLGPPPLGPPTGPPLAGASPPSFPPPSMPGPPAPPSTDGTSGNRASDNRTSDEAVRPWWGMGDALMVIPLTIGAFMIGLVIIAVLTVVEGVDFAEVVDSETADLPASMLILPTLVQQGMWFAWPFIVSKWKGLGPAEDWGWAFKPVDLGIGFGTAMIAMTVAGGAGALVGALVGLEDEAQAENTRIITDLEGSPWLWAMLFVVVIGAPFSEELLFRGLILRSVQKRWGSVVGVIGSLVVFVPIHFADGGITSDGQIVLWVSIAALGAVLAIAAVLTKRLAAPIIAHIIINGLASAGALGVFDGVFS